jgi:hypothetical protein
MPRFVFDVAEPSTQNPMKISKILLAVGVLSGASSFMFAGPGPQYWQNQTKAAAAREAAKSDKTAPAEKQSTAPVKDGVCEKCACSTKCACSGKS